MKIFIISIVLLILMLLIIITNFFYVLNTTEKFYDMVSSMSFDKACADSSLATELQKEWQSKKDMLSFSVNYSLIFTIDDLIASMRALAISEERGNYESVRASLLNAISDMKRLECIFE